MAKRERMSSVDTAWLRMDAPNNLMVIVGVMIFDQPLDIARFKKTIESRMLTYSRFKQRVDVDASGAYWEADPYFSLDAHIHRSSLPGAGGKDELQAYVADLVGQQLDRNKPLWQFHVIENYEGGTAVIARIHHCIADGIALVGVMLNLTDDTAEGNKPLFGKRHHDDDEDNFWKTIFQPLTSAMVSTIKLSSSFWSKYLQLVANPSKVFDYARVGATVATEIAQLATMPNDSATRLKGKPGVTKRVAWTEPLPLNEVKAVGKALGASVNDILLSSVAGALRQYLQAKGDPVDGVEIRAYVPVNLRPRGEEAKLGNRFGLVALSLPIGISNPLARLFEVRRRMEELKGSYQAALTLGALGLVGMCPKPVQRQILDLLAKKGTAVMTNVPGPQNQLYLAGSALKQMMFWVPQSGDIGVGVSILSYNGGVQFGLISDHGFVPNPDEVVGYFLPEFEKLVKGLLLMPWDEKMSVRTMETALGELVNATAATPPVRDVLDTLSTGEAEPLAAPARPAAKRLPARRSAAALPKPDAKVPAEASTPAAKDTANAKPAAEASAAPAPATSPTTADAPKAAASPKPAATGKATAKLKATPGGRPATAARQPAKPKTAAPGPGTVPASAQPAPAKAAGSKSAAVPATAAAKPKATTVKQAKATAAPAAVAPAAVAKPIAAAAAVMPAATKPKATAKPTRKSAAAPTKATTPVADQPAAPVASTAVAAAPASLGNGADGNSGPAPTPADQNGPAAAAATAPIAKPAGIKKKNSAFARLKSGE